ncbi:hypothetical protein FBULB1_11098 [Fusarium bulbicola]|nr:hypothetical protein FBULB1_11098 [Fusarium bulbicola]
MAPSWLSTLALLPLLALAESDGFGAKPVVGYNSYNDVVCSPNQTYMHDTITAMKQKGFVDLGYTMFQIDCGWFSKERAANGSITYDNETFPDGISPLSNACPIYVKADNCFAPDNTLVQRYTNLSNALKDVGINSMMDSVFRITNKAIHVILQGNSGPGHYGNMDLLEVRNPGMTQSQQATHFAIWAMFKSALIISTNVVDMPSKTQSILSNTGLIAINQDDLRAPVRLIQRYPNYDVYAGPLSGGNMAILIVDQSRNGSNYYLDFNSLNVSRADYAKLQPYGSSALRLTNIQAYTPPAVTYNYIKGSSGVVNNGAKLADCSACSSGQAARYVGGGQSDGGGSVTFTDIKTSKATQNVKIDYINCKIIYPNQSSPNARGTRISVNGANSVNILFPVSGYSWKASVLPDFLVELSGFSTSQPNNITITSIPNGVPNTSSYAPNIASISYELEWNAQAKEMYFQAIEYFIQGGATLVSSKSSLDELRSSGLGQTLLEVSMIDFAKFNSSAATTTTGSAPRHHKLILGQCKEMLRLVNSFSNKTPQHLFSAGLLRQILPFAHKAS